MSLFAYNKPLGKLIRAPLRAIPEGTVLPVLRGPARGKRWVAGACTNGCWLGTYEPEMQKALIDAIRPGSLFYDVGANAGFFTLLAASLGARVVAFEPDPRNLSYLRRHVELNKLQSQVEIVPCAVAAHRGTVRFISNGCVSRCDDAAGNLTVETVSLDDFAAPDVMKMDIEGAEFSAIDGMMRMLARKPVRLFIAVHSDAQLPGLRNKIASLGYSVRLEDEIGLVA